MENIIPAKLITIRHGVYSVYVFKNIDNGEYLMCTRLPKWKTPDVNLGDEGFLQTETIKAGEEYYNAVEGKTSVYQYSNVYFKNFVLEPVKTIKNSEVVL